MKSFKDLIFNPHSVGNGVQATLDFDNGYGVSVVRFKGSYGCDLGLWELAVFKGDNLCYDTPVTSGVEGYHTEDGVSELMRKVQAL